MPSGCVMCRAGWHITQYGSTRGGVPSPLGLVTTVPDSQTAWLDELERSEKSKAV